MTQIRCSDESLCGRTRFLLVRHGQTDWNSEQRIQGHTDVPLNAEGLRQAAAMAERLASYERAIAAIYSSDLRRARVTAEAIAHKYALNVTVDSNLREVYRGQAQGLLKAEYEARFGSVRRMLDETHADIAIRWNYSEVPDGEPRNSLIKRLHARMAEIAYDYDDRTVILVSHAGAIRTLILASIVHDRELFDTYYAYPLANCSIAEFVYSDGACTFKKMHEL